MGAGRAADSSSPTALWPWPALSGDAAGTLTITGLPDVHWRVTTAVPATAGRQRLLVVVEADGLKLSGELELDPATRDGAWQLTEATVDTAIWLPLIAEKFSLAWLKEISATGTARLLGEGPLREGEPDGTLTIALRDATLTHASSGGTFEGVTAALRLDGLRMLRVSAEQAVTFRTARAGGITFANGRVVFSLPDGKTLRLASAEAETLGGRATLEPFDLVLSAPEGLAVDLRARFAGIDFSQVLPLLTKAGISGAQGRLDGRMALHWSARTGLDNGEADFATADAGPSAIIRLSPLPGLLTGHMPEKIAVLPLWSGPLRRWTAARNPVFAPLQDIELGRTSLAVESLRLELPPGGDAGARTLLLRLAARPTPASLVPRVTFDVKVDGPLQELLRLGRENNLTLPEP